MSRSFRQYADDLRAAPARLQRVHIPEVARRAAGEAQRRGKILVSRRFVNRTNKLRRSVRGRALIADTTSIQLTAGGPRVPYAAIQEFGGSIQFRGQGFIVVRIPGVGFRNVPRTRRITLRGRHYLRDSILSVRETLGPKLHRAIRQSYFPGGFDG